MPKDKIENHEKIVTAAKKEFMIYGFKDASMSQICFSLRLKIGKIYRP